MPASYVITDLTSVLNEFYSYEPVVQSSGKNALRIMGGSFSTTEDGSQRVFIDAPALVTYSPSQHSWSLTDDFGQTHRTASMYAGQPTLAAGKDYGVLLGAGGVIRVVELSGDTVPAFQTVDSAVYRCLGGFHTLCGSVGTLAMRPTSAFPGQSHPLSGFLAADILPKSVWSVNFRPACPDPRGMVYIDGVDIWMDIYLASGSMSDLKSVACEKSGSLIVKGAALRRRYWQTFIDGRTTTYSVFASYTQFVTGFSKRGKRLPTSEEFYAAAVGSNCRTPANGAIDPDSEPNALGTAEKYARIPVSPMSDADGQRMVSAAGCEAMCGLLNQWLSPGYVYPVVTDEEVMDFQVYDTTDTSVLTGNVNSMGMFAKGTKILIAGGAWNTLVNGVSPAGPLYRSVAQGDEQVIFDSENVMEAGFYTVGGRGCCKCIHL